MHFFIDHRKITELTGQANVFQASEDQYGPVTGHLTTQYNVTSKFQMTQSAKAFACQAGLMIVQQSEIHESLVNLIIKPTIGKIFPDNIAQYYIYRGILKSTLIKDSNVVTQD